MTPQLRNHDLSEKGESMTSTSVDPHSGACRTVNFSDTSAIEHREIIERADHASVLWAATSACDRAAALRSIADALDGARVELVELADAETGLGQTRLSGEVGRTTAQLRMFADVITHGAHLAHAGIAVPPAGDASSSPQPPDLRRYHLPLGPVAVFAASNFPFAFSVAGGDTASALAAGCPVVVKAHPAHPELALRTARLVGDALSTAGAHPGVFALVSGLNEGTRLVTDPAIRAAAFTGSFTGGRALADLAAARPEPIPFYGEYGSVNPVFVLADGIDDADRFVNDYLDSLTMGGGQFCTNPGLLIAPRQARLASLIAQRILSRPAATMLHHGIHAAVTAAVEKLKATPGLQALESAAAVPADGVHVGPVVFQLSAATALAQHELIDDEYFGPVGMLVEYENDDEMLALGDVLRGCLVSCIHAGEDSELVRRVLSGAAARSGRVVWRGWPTGVAVAAGQHHGGPFPATSNAHVTSVGPDAIMRFLRPVAFQDVPAHLVPAEVQR
jgi:NADP-dependent aldehyde dehydrogenase